MEKKLMICFVTKASLDFPEPGKKEGNLRILSENIRLGLPLCSGIRSHLFPLELSRLCCSILKLFQLLLPNGIENPVIIARIIPSRCLAVGLATVKQDFRSISMLRGARFCFRVQIC